MKVVICLDDNGGMLFNRRRQSRDKTLLTDMGADVKKTSGTLYIAPFSEKLLADTELVYTVCEDMLNVAGENDTCFVEDRHLGECVERISRLTVYRWGRKYPHDFSLDIDISDCGFRLTESSEFVGNSHEKITKETYTK